MERFFALGLYIPVAAELVVLPLVAIGPDQMPRLFPDSWRPVVELVLAQIYYPGVAVGLILMVAKIVQDRAEAQARLVSRAPRAQGWRPRSFWWRAPDCARTFPTSTGMD